MRTRFERLLRVNLKIELKNIGGLRGTHSFEFKNNLNILSSPNATGKSSLLKAIYLVMANKQLSPNELNEILTERELDGFVRMSYKESDYEVHLQKKEDSVIISFNNVKEKIFPIQSRYLGFLFRDSEIYNGIFHNNPLTIKNWFSNMTEVYKFKLFLEITQRIYSEFKNNIEKLQKDDKEDLAERKKQLLLIEEEIKILEEEIKEIKKSSFYKRYLKDHAREEKQLELLNKNIIDLENKLMREENKKIEVNLKLENLQKDLEDKKQKLESFLKERPIYLEKLNEITIKIDNINAKINNFELDIENLNNDLIKAEGLFKDYKKLEDREECPLCHQSLDRELIKNLVEELTKRVGNLKKNRENFLKEKRYLELERKDLDIDYDSIKKKTLLDETRINKEIKDLKSDNDKIKIDIETIDRKIVKYEENLNENRNERDLLIKKLNSEADNKLIHDLNSKRETKASKERLKNKFNREITDFELTRVELKQFIKRSNLAEEIKDHYVDIVQKLLNELTDEINSKLEKSFDLLHLAELEKITISSEGDYRIDIQRKNKVYTTLTKMSSAERELIVLIIFFVVQRTVIPNLPIFLIDEVTSDMDDTRFQEILKYISKEVEIVIVARPSPYKGEKIIKKENIITLT